MKNKLAIILGLCGLQFCTLVIADGILSEPINKPWRSVIGVGGGVGIATDVGKAQTFPILDPIADEYFIYTPMDQTQTSGMFDVFLGVERQVFAPWLLQAGLAYSQASSYNAQGAFVQGVSPSSADQYTYKYRIVTRELLAQAKLMYPYHNRFYPYFLLGVGGAYNTSSHFLTDVPSFLTFTREYTNHNAASFAYRVGLGIDVDVIQHVRLGVAYRFSGQGRVELGSGSINQINVPGTLSQSSFNVNEVLLQLTFIMDHARNNFPF